MRFAYSVLEKLYDLLEKKTRKVFSYFWEHSLGINHNYNFSRAKPTSRYTKLYPGYHYIVIRALYENMRYSWYAYFVVGVDDSGKLFCQRVEYDKSIVEKLEKLCDELYFEKISEKDFKLGVDKLVREWLGFDVHWHEFSPDMLDEKKTLTVRLQGDLCLVLKKFDVDEFLRSFSDKALCSEAILKFSRFVKDRLSEGNRRYLLRYFMLYARSKRKEKKQYYAWRILKLLGLPSFWIEYLREVLEDRKYKLKTLYRDYVTYHIHGKQTYFSFVDMSPEPFEDPEKVKVELEDLERRFEGELECILFDTCQCRVVECMSEKIKSEFDVKRSVIETLSSLEKRILLSFDNHRVMLTGVMLPPPNSLRTFSFTFGKFSAEVSTLNNLPVDTMICEESSQPRSSHHVYCILTLRETRITAIHYEHMTNSIVVPPLTLVGFRFLRAHYNNITRRDAVNMLLSSS